METKSRIELPKTLNSFERAMAHDVATSLGLCHESKGEGVDRQLCVWAPGAETAAPSNVGSAAPSRQDASARKAAAKKGPLDSLGRTPQSESRGSGDDEDNETALQAFERRAAALIDSLGPGQPVAEWKAPTDEEKQILQRVAAEKGLELLFVGSGKKSRCRVEVEVEEEAKLEGVAAAPLQGKDSAAQRPANKALADLHAAKTRRDEEASAARRLQIEEAKDELKVAKKAGKQKKAAAAPQADDDDLDAVLLEFAGKDGICAFGTCKEKCQMLMDSISKCRYCNNRFCLKHAQAEVHGCEDAAQRSEQKLFKQQYEAPRGNGLANKPSGASRSAVANKLQEKLQSSQASRTVKKKDGNQK